MHSEKNKLMPNKRRRGGSRDRNKQSKTFWATWYLILSTAATILISFGLVNWFEYQGWNPIWAVLIGIVILMIMALTGKYITEGLFARKY